MAVEGDLRFLSHHDLLRAVQRIARRAQLPLHYSQGFNPRPELSLPCPRPTGVASRDDRLVLSLDEPVESPALIAALNDQSPPGMRFGDPRFLDTKHSPQPREVRYELALGGDRVRRTEQTLQRLDDLPDWTVTRTKPGNARRGGKKPAPARTLSLDLKSLVRDLRIENDRLRFTLVPDGDRWAKPVELLTFIGIDDPADHARVVRVGLMDDT
jgi:radical SAM-linked protein